MSPLAKARLQWLLASLFGAGLLASAPVAWSVAPGDLVFELPIGADLGAPFKGGLTAGLLVGTFDRTSNVMLLESVDGVLLEGRLGANAGTLSLGAASSIEGGALGWGLLAEVTQTWRGLLNGPPWWVPPDRTLFGARVQFAAMFTQVFVGAQWCGCPSKDRLLTMGNGFRYPVLSPSGPQ